MDHTQAVARQAPERYLLEEMTEPERFDFEEHYFACEECAEDVRAGAAMARGIHAVYAAEPSRIQTPSKVTENKSRWFGWFTASSLVPSFAAVSFAMVAGYQALLVIPPLREAGAARAVTPFVLRAAARGDEPTLVADGRGGMSILALDVNSGQPGQILNWELLSPQSALPLRGSGQVPPAGSQLLIVIPGGKIGRPGSWTLNLRNADGAVRSYPFKVVLR